VSSASKRARLPGVEAEVVIFYKELLNMSMIESKMFFVNKECSNPDSVKVGVPKRYVLIPFFFFNLYK
jgi:hypothetical protein